MVGFGLNIATFVLLSFTAYLSYQTHVFQVRTSIRESLEQLDDFDLANNVKVKPVLHDFEHSVFENSRTDVMIQFNTTHEHPATASNPLARARSWLENQNADPNDVISRIREFEGVSNVEYANGNDGIIVTFDTEDAVLIRREIRAAMVVLLDEVSGGARLLK